MIFRNARPPSSPSNSGTYAAISAAGTLRLTPV
ncbi:Uncharacterised protein [Mycobacteroides abscessus subsp. abscessus]|nr:Uncharacterised protein [Mycobacteroides abscessus subsp. abscessus]